MAEISGTNINYTRAGSGPALVFLHAGIADSRMWTPQFDAFSKFYDVIAPDIRGFGKTPPIDGQFSYFEDTEKLLDHLDLTRVVVVGCSFGGAIALDFALNRPDRISALVLVCSAIGGFEWTGDTPEIAQRIDEACDQDNVDLANEIEVERWVIGYNRTRSDVDPDIIKLVLDMNRIALTMPELGEEIGSKPDAIERLAEITIPTLVIGATNDDPISRARTEILSSQILTAQTVWLDKAGHLPSLERPDQFNEVLRTFLKEFEIS